MLDKTKILEKEELKDIEGFEGYYMAGSLGNVYRVKYKPNCSFEIVRKIKTHHGSSPMATLHADGYGKSYNLRRLIHDTFRPEHKHKALTTVNGNKWDCSLKNIVTKPYRRYGFVDSEFVRKVKFLLKNRGKRTYKDIGREMGCSRQTISNIDKGKYEEK